MSELAIGRGFLATACNNQLAQTRRFSYAYSIMAATKLMGQLMALPPRERLQLASQLLASVDEIEPADWQAAWTIELDRRFAEDHGGQSWASVRADIETQS
jgi:putative addiction module component (TIGR02574 family)